MSKYIYEKNARILIGRAFKLLSIFELIIIVVLGIYCYILTSKIDKVKPLPIFINRESGGAKPVDFDFIDASGETRCTAEINDFTTKFIMDLYTFNRLTVKSNLLSALSKTSKEGAVDIKNALLISKRYDRINRNLQGIVLIKGISIIQKLPDLKVQVFFNKRLMTIGGRVESDRDSIAIIRIKPIVRKKGNAHGLLIVEYRESPLNIPTGGTDEN